MNNIFDYLVTRLNDDYRFKTAKTAYNLAGLGGLSDYLFSKIFNLKIIKSIEVKADGVAAPFKIRMPSSDILTYCQIFIDKEYSFNVSRPPLVIFDAGANIGLASIYFATRFPSAQIVAIEPEKENFDLLAKNTANYKNIITLNVALWNENGLINLLDPGLGSSGFMTANTATGNVGDQTKVVRAMTVDCIMKEYGIDHIDILKMDIKGAEMEVFDNPDLWISNVDSFVVELHERMKHGSSANFYRAINHFPYKWIEGENVCATRSEGCVVVG